MIRGNRALVIGAGLAGLTVALALMRAGWQVQVYEQAHVLGDVGAGISLSPGAGKALASLGLAAPLLEASLPIPNVAFVHYRTGALLAGMFDRGRPPDHGFATARHIHRADLHGILLAGVLAIDPHAVVTSKRLTGVVQDGSGVQARFADETSAEGDILIGADGARSAVRRLLFNDAPPEFAGQIAFRCLIPFAEAAPFMGAGNAVVSIGAARIFHRYLIRGGSLVNVIGIAQSAQWCGEGWNTPASQDDFLAEFAGFHGDVVGLIRQAPPQSLIKWGLFVRPPLTEWSAGRVVLMGDAAHPILPFLGMGAALAIEDAIVLTRALAHAHSFASFQQARVERVDLVRTQTLKQGEIIQGADPDAPAVTNAPSQNVDLFNYDPCEAPIGQAS